MIYIALKHVHSFTRWALLFFLVISLTDAIIRWAGRKEYRNIDRKLGLYTVIFAHLQLIFGLVLYFISPKVVFGVESMKINILRFFLVEHPAAMIIAIILITIGYSRAKKATGSSQKFRAYGIFCLIALLLILWAIPWPWRQFGTGWI